MEKLLKRMQKFLKSLICGKFKSELKTLNFNSVALVFLGNHKLFYDNFSFSVLKFLRIKAKVFNLKVKVFYCYNKNGIYGSQFNLLNIWLKNFNGAVIFIDSGLCLKKEELGLIKIAHGKVCSVANQFGNEAKVFKDFNCLKIVLNCATTNGVFLNEMAKNNKAKFVANLICKTLLTY